MNELEKWATYYVDKGCARQYLNEMLCAEYIGNPAIKPFITGSIAEAIDDLIDSNILVQGQERRNNMEWIIVREWMPETAKRMDEQNEKNGKESDI